MVLLLPVLFALLLCLSYQKRFTLTHSFPSLPQNGVRVNGIPPTNGNGSVGVVSDSESAKAGLKRPLETDDQPNGAPEMKVVKMEKNADGTVVVKTVVNGDVSQETKTQLASSTAAPRNHSIPPPSSNAVSTNASLAPSQQLPAQPLPSHQPQQLQNSPGSDQRSTRQTKRGGSPPRGRQCNLRPRGRGFRLIVK